MAHRAGMAPAHINVGAQQAPRGIGEKQRAGLEQRADSQRFGQQKNSIRLLHDLKGGQGPRLQWLRDGVGRGRCGRMAAWQAAHLRHIRSKQGDLDGAVGRFQSHAAFGGREAVDFAGFVPQTGPCGAFV